MKGEVPRQLQAENPYGKAEYMTFLAIYSPHTAATNVSMRLEGKKSSSKGPNKEGRALTTWPEIASKAPPNWNYPGLTFEPKTASGMSRPAKSLAGGKTKPSPLQFLRFAASMPAASSFKRGILMFHQHNITMEVDL
jgi:hypothetical protein